TAAEDAEVIPLGPPAESIPGPPADGAAPAGAAEPSTEERLAELSVRAASALEVVQQEYQELLAAGPARREHLALLADRSDLLNAEIDVASLAPERFDERVEQVRVDLDAITGRIMGLVDPSKPPGDSTAVAERLDALAAALLELSLVQARARLDKIDIEPTDLSDDDALAIALLYRRDIKNSRSALVDSWRLINFNANDLRSDVDLTFSGDLGNVGDNPFRLRDTNGRLRVGLEFDGPLTRLSERNVYRQSLIEFQQARRTYYQFVDRVFQGLRGTLRQVRLNEVNLELRRQAVLVAITQVDLTQLRLSEPPKPGEETQLSSTTARDLVDALADLLSVQNDFLSVWVNNQVQLLSLEFNLGLMELDAAGQRIPLALPLKDFLTAVPCPSPGGPERLPSDIQAAPVLPRALKPGPVEPFRDAAAPTPPRVETPPEFPGAGLEFTPDLTLSPPLEGPAPSLEGDPMVVPVSYDAVAKSIKVRRLPTP
ncbi:MAG: TolC family protein, partial [Planctomycetota bacterium]